VGGDSGGAFVDGSCGWGNIPPLARLANTDRTAAKTGEAEGGEEAGRGVEGGRGKRKEGRKRGRREEEEEEEEEGVSVREMESFLRWLSSFLLSSLYPSAPYERKIMALDLLNAMLETWPPGHYTITGCTYSTPQKVPEEAAGDAAREMRDSATGVRREEGRGENREGGKGGEERGCS